MTIGKILKDKRIERAFTQQDVAEKLFVSRQTISNWECGKTYPDLVTIIELSTLYDIPLDTLLKNDNQVVKEIKKKNTFPLKVLMSCMAFIILFLCAYNFTNAFAKQESIVTLHNQSYLIKRSFFGYGKAYYLFDASGKVLHKIPTDETGEFLIINVDEYEEARSTYTFPNKKNLPVIL